MRRRPPCRRPMETDAQRAERERNDKVNKIASKYVDRMQAAITNPDEFTRLADEYRAELRANGLS